MKIGQVTSSFIHPRKPISNGPTKDELRSSELPEFKYQNARVSERELFPGEEQIEDDKGKWLKKLFQNPNFYKPISGLIEQLGNTKEESKQLLDESIKVAESSTIWAVDTKNNSGVASASIGLSFIPAIINIILKNFEALPTVQWISKIADLTMTQLGVLTNRG